MKIKRKKEPMKITIQSKIILIYLCTIVMIMLACGTYIVYQTEERDLSSVQQTMKNISYNLVSTGNTDIRNAVSNLNDYYEIYCLNAEGVVIIGSSPSYKVGEKVASSVVIETIVHHREATSPIRHFSSLLSQNVYLEHAQPTLDGRIIYVRASTKAIYDNMLSIIQTISIGLIFAMLMAGVCSIIFSKMITAPIKTLSIQSKKLAAGNVITRIPVEASDEIGELTQNFNNMASKLSSTMGVLTSEKNKLEKIFEHMADGVMAFNQQGILIHANPVCYEMFGASRMGANFEVIFERIGINADFDRLLAGEPFENTDEYIIVDDKYLELQFDVYQNSKGDSSGLVVVISDVTKLQKLDQMRKEFVANVSHELRTPLTTIKIYTETLVDTKLEDKGHALWALGVMEKEADRMTTLVQDLLELSRIDNRQIQLHFTIVDLSEIIAEVIEAQHIHIMNKGHTITMDYDPNVLYKTKGDAARLKQVLHNILSNSVKYTEDGGAIHIHMEKVPGFIKVSISDTGMGIPEEDLKRIFERFYRVDKARSRKLGGTGLGLSIAKELMILHEGDIQIKSEFGKGTEMILFFKEV